VVESWGEWWNVELRLVVVVVSSREWWETAQIREGLFVARSEYFCPMALVENEI